MNIFEKMESEKKFFTKNDYVVYNYIKKFPNSFNERSTTDIISDLQISQASLTRFAQKLGFNGISDFQYQYKIDLKNYNESDEKTSSAMLYGDLLLETEKCLDEDLLKTLKSFYNDADSIYLLGYNLSKLPAMEFDILYKVAGNKNVQFVNYDQFTFKTPDRSLIFVYSAMRGEAFLKGLSQMDKGNGTKIVLITMNRKHVLRKYVDLTVILPSANKDNVGKAYLAETMCFLMFNDILIEYLFKN